MYIHAAGTYMLQVHTCCMYIYAAGTCMLQVHTCCRYIYAAGTYMSEVSSVVSTQTPVKALFKTNNKKIGLNIIFYI